MKKYFLLLLFFCIFLPNIYSQQALVDSLQNKLENVSSTEEKLQLMTTLMDAVPKEEINEYAKKLYQEASEANNLHYKEIALTELLRYYVNYDIKDTANYYLNIAEKELKGKYKECLLTYMKAIMDVRVVYYTDSEEEKKILEKNLFKLKADKHISDIEKMAACYILGMSLSSKIRPDDGEEQAQEMLSYFNIIAELGEKMPLEYGILFLPNTYFIICAYQKTAERGKVALRYLKLLTDYTRQVNRPYTLKRQFLSAYSVLASMPDAIGKKQASHFYKEFINYLQQYPEAANVTPEYDYLATSILYYKNLRDYRRVISLNDSLIDFFESVPELKPNVVIAMQDQVAFYDSLHMYKEAYDTYKQCSILLDSARAKNVEDHLKDLEIQKNVNQLIVEKAALELKLEKQKAQVYLFSAMFLFTLCGVVFVAFRLGKIKSLYKKLQKSNQLVIIASEKAQESEKMKNAFIKNMCHEVRTPLNAINGFAELISSDEISVIEKKEFNRIIFENCNQLTSMMNDVLIIAQLDSSNTALPLTPTHIHTLFMHEMEELKRNQGKSFIEYKLEGDKTNDLIQTDSHYLSLIINHLLQNANKFTQKGSIVLAYQLDPDQKQMQISVTDTGCGIDPEKEDWIFERFTKANDFIPGSGLGLYLCRMIAERLNGTVRLDITYTEGARFILTLPTEADDEETKLR